MSSRREEKATYVTGLEERFVDNAARRVIVCVTD